VSDIAEAVGLVARILPDGREARLCPQIYTWRLVVGWPQAMRDGYSDYWCYHRFEDAIAAMTSWDGSGEPCGWHRHPPSGRRRPDGDKAREYVNP